MYQEFREYFINKIKIRTIHHEQCGDNNYSTKTINTILTKGVLGKLIKNYNYVKTTLGRLFISMCKDKRFFLEFKF